MTETKKPRSPLPWEFAPDVPQRRLIRSVGGPVVAYDVPIPEADYIVHAANAYPKLVELLKVISEPEYLKSDESQRFLVTLRARAILAELGELPAE